MEAVAMDMWEPYIQSVQTYVPQADRKIVFDVFHILQHMNEAVDRVRRHEHRLLRAQGDETLTGSKYVWLYGEENVRDHHQARFTELTRRGAGRRLQTARAWALKESLRDLWRCRSQRAAEAAWRWWYGWAARARLAPVLKVARMIKRHLLCLRLQRGCGEPGWGRDGLGTGAQGRGARARRALMSTMRPARGARESTACPTTSAPFRACWPAPASSRAERAPRRPSWRRIDRTWPRTATSSPGFAASRTG